MVVLKNTNYGGFPCIVVFHYFKLYFKASFLNYLLSFLFTYSQHVINQRDGRERYSNVSL